MKMDNSLLFIVVHEWIEKLDEDDKWTSSVWMLLFFLFGYLKGKVLVVMVDGNQNDKNVMLLKGIVDNIYLQN